MAAVRLSQLQKHILRWLAAEHQRTKGVIASSHYDLVCELQRDKGSRSHSLRTLERHGLLSIQRSLDGHAESLMLTPAGQKQARAAHRTYRASLARGNALFFHTIRWKELDTYCRRVVLVLRQCEFDQYAILRYSLDTIHRRSTQTCPRKNTLWISVLQNAPR